VPAVLALVALGIALRLASYLANPTFSTDEAALALNVMHRSYGDLLDELDFNQGAPVGFLFAQRALFEVGSSEYVFRLLPLVASLVALLLFYPVAARFLERRAALLALALFAVSEPLLFYSATAKQYAVDVAATVGLYAVALWFDRASGWRPAVTLAVVAAVAVWLSHPAVIVLAGIIFVLALQSIVERRWRRLLTLAAICSAWLASLGVVYVVALRELAGLQATFARGRGFVAAEAEGGLARVLASAARYLLGIPENSGEIGLPEVLTLVGVLLALLGFATLLRARWTYALLLGAPAGFTLLVSALGKYPLFPRALLFLTPALVILVAAGIHSLAIRPRRVRRVAALAAAVALLAGAGASSAQHLSSPGDEVKQLLGQLARSQKPGDALYVFHPLQYTFRYYLECECFGDASTVNRGRSLWPLEPAEGGPGQNDPALRSVPPSFVVGQAASESPDRYEADLAALRGRERVWLLLGASQPEHLRAVLASADRVGVETWAFEPTGEPPGAYLYDFSRRP
jgi:hypothetical protein